MSPSVLRHTAAATAARSFVWLRSPAHGQHRALSFTTPTTIRHCSRQPCYARPDPATFSAAGRAFHSFDHPNETPSQDRFSDAENAILTAAARHIPTHGFTEHTVALGVYDAGYPAISINILPDGVFSLVRWHLMNQRTNLATRCREILGEAPPDDVVLAPAEVASRAERIIWGRLLGNKDVVGRWQEALAIMAQPSYIPASLRELSLLADEIWALAGDKAVDPSWYTKRAAVSAIYVSSELFMTTDSSGPEFPATREFLERRFRESQELGGYVRSVGEWVSFAASAGVNVLRSKGVNV
ncbi:ubiquinone biosynthesis protein mitochondrial precursor [Sporothrix brasiliensis 5110]|uniref:Ubiquinone biosynthesis protein n=1 Tax=Sporothrix brasiliensis 5110 TaxID=1398154 RepID=A0A0C2IIX1_9PEZI|nr:ubiquinone biosynthesis protein mitochondrial precursor [Sporothrix brasiliensis 5110]KIH89111.1 ubiquinone biosynthesis protein mitochondrial precursor [Sporothrix brasiliensis 5110]